jgi:hypothetical protein
MRTPTDEEFAKMFGEDPGISPDDHQKLEQLFKSVPGLRKEMSPLPPRPQQRPVGPGQMYEEASMRSPLPKNRKPWDTPDLHTKFLPDLNSWRPQYRGAQNKYSMRVPSGETVVYPEDNTWEDQLWGTAKGIPGSDESHPGSVENDVTVKPADALDTEADVGRSPDQTAPIGPYDTKLTPQEELLFKTWKAENAPYDSGYDYDIRGAFKAGLHPAANGHWSDQFKKPNHPTFSDQSQYSNRQTPGGHWYTENGKEFLVPFGPRPRPVNPKNIDPNRLLKMQRTESYDEE